MMWCSGWMLLMLCVAHIAFVDAGTYTIPQKSLACIFILSIILPVGQWWPGKLALGFFLAICMTLARIIPEKKIVGWGDVRLVPILGWLLPVEAVAPFLMVSAFFSLLQHAMDHRSMCPFAPPLAAGFFWSVLHGF